MSGNSAWIAAGWSRNYYWTGEVRVNGRSAFLVYVNGGGNPPPVDLDYPVVCLR